MKLLLLWDPPGGLLPLLFYADPAHSGMVSTDPHGSGADRVEHTGSQSGGIFLFEGT